ncbi:hypothetical protein E0371_06550 [Campylobacter coli]|nr:hypothetical protein [Campylobacter coli]
MENQERVEFVNQLNDDIKKHFLKLYLKGVFGSKEITKKLIEAKSYNLNIEEIVKEGLKLKCINDVINLKNHYEVVRKKYRISKKWKNGKMKNLAQSIKWWKKNLKI